MPCGGQRLQHLLKGLLHLGRTLRQAELAVAVEAPAAPAIEEASSATVEAAPLEPAAEAVETAATEVAPVAVETAQAAAETAPAVVAEAAAPAPVDLSTALVESGLVLIETRPGATQAVQPEPPAAPVQPRRRRPAVKVVDEPLIQVETGQK